MGTFQTKVTISHIAHRKRKAELPSALVDTGSEYTWIPSDVLEKIGVGREKKDLSFTMAKGQFITRSVGFAVVRVGACFTVDEVVFGEKGDLCLLGARSLEGLNLRVDSRAKRLVAAGPILAAGTVRTASLSS